MKVYKYAFAKNKSTLLLFFFFASEQYKDNEEYSNLMYINSVKHANAHFKNFIRARHKIVPN